MNISTGNRIRIFISLILINFLFGCNLAEEKPKVSTDLNSLKILISLDIEYKTVSWEVFSTPEHTGGVPGPTDYLTLIAEIEPQNNENFRQLGKSGIVWIAPESDRPWLEPNFRTLLRNSKNTSLDISKSSDCKAVSGILNKTKKTVYGFACEGDKKILVYLRLANFT